MSEILSLYMVLHTTSSASPKSKHIKIHTERRFMLSDTLPSYMVLHTTSSASPKSKHIIVANSYNSTVGTYRAHGLSDKLRRLNLAEPPNRELGGEKFVRQTSQTNFGRAAEPTT
jgi:hypothetical protein